jgi:hypothetical protein
VCEEFNVTSEELFQKARGKDNLLHLMVIFLARELGAGPVRAPRGSYGRFKKYLKLIPGLSRKCEELKAKIIKKVDGS